MQLRVKMQGKLNTHIITESVLMTLTENYQNWSMLVEATVCHKVGTFFETQCSLCFVQCLAVVAYE